MAAKLTDEDLEQRFGAQKKGVTFDAQLPDGASPEAQRLYRDIKKSAESLMFVWSVFPVKLPPSITDGDDAATLDMSNLLVPPNFDELHQVAHDAHGNVKRLSPQQLADLREDGEFGVPSANFPGQEHRWRLNALLQKGSVRTSDTFLKGLSVATRLLIITAKDRFFSRLFSLRDAAHGWWDCFWKLADIVVGMPRTVPDNVGPWLRDEVFRYMTADLDVKGGHRDVWQAFCAFVVENQLTQPSSKKAKDPPGPPYVFHNAKGGPVDLRLFNKGVLEECLPHLQAILEAQVKGWTVQHKERLVGEAQEQGLSGAELAEHVRKGLEAEYHSRVYKAVLESSALEAIEPGIGEVLVAQAKAVLLISSAINAVYSDLKLHQAQVERKLVSEHEVRGRIRPWVDRHLEASREDYLRRQRFSAHERAIAGCRQAGLQQALYFLQRHLAFTRDREPVLLQELRQVRKPARTFSFPTFIWLPSNYRVFRTFKGVRERITTVLRGEPGAGTENPTDPAHPEERPIGWLDTAGSEGVRRRGRPVTSSAQEREEKVYYALEQTVPHETSTRYPFWRWLNFLKRAWCWTWNSVFFLGVVVPWASPVGVRALLLPHRFIAGWRLNHDDGVLERDPRSETATMVSQLRSLWRHVKTSRARFEAEPDTGFLGKSFTRYLNVVWNYVLKLCVGGLGIVVLYPPVCLVASTISLALAVLAPLWVPVAALLWHVFMFVLFDLDGPRGHGNRVMTLCEAIIWNLGLRGVLQPVAAMLTAGVVCPLASAVVALGSGLQWVLRRGWDNVVYYVVIRRLGRVPASGTWVARRVTGPGLAAEFSFTVRPEQALAALEARLEEVQLDHWSLRTHGLVNKPAATYTKFFNTLLKPVSCGVTSGERGVYHSMVTQQTELLRVVNDLTRKRRQLLTIDFADQDRRRIKLTTEQLKLVIARGAELVKDFYTSKIFPLMDTSEQDFWEQAGLRPNYWLGLTSQLYRDIFSPHFLVPLEDSDTHFRLDVEHIDLERYATMLTSMDLHDDLDRVTPLLLTPEVEEVSVQPPHSQFLFDPRQTDWGNKLRLHAEGRDGGLPLEPHLPLPHPSLISLHIWNRENEGAQVDIERVRWLLARAENLPYTLPPRTGSAGLARDASALTEDTTDRDDVTSGGVTLAEGESLSSEVELSETHRGYKPVPTRDDDDDDDEEEEEG